MVLEINNKEVSFGYGLYFLGKAIKKNDTDLSGLLQSLVKNPLSDMVDLMFFSAQCEAEIDGVDLNITKREFLVFLDSTDDFKHLDGALAKWSKKLLETIQGSFTVDNEDLKESSEEKKN